MGCCCGKETVKVTAAGCPEVNGTYYRNGEYCGKPSFQLENSTIEMWYNTEWRIGHTNDYYYTNDDDSDQPPVKGWIIAQTYHNKAAVDPTPVVVRSCC